MTSMVKKKAKRRHVLWLERQQIRHTKQDNREAQRQTDQRTEWPDVRLAAELAVFDDLWGWPLDRELGALGACVLIIKNKSTGQRVDTHHHTAVHVKWLLTIVKNITNTVIKKFCTKIQKIICQLWKTYLVMPKSDTFTSLFFETRQFLAAYRGKRKRGRINYSNSRDTKVGL